MFIAYLIYWEHEILTIARGNRLQNYLCVWKTALKDSFADHHMEHEEHDLVASVKLYPSRNFENYIDNNDARVKCYNVWGLPKEVWMNCVKHDTNKKAVNSDMTNARDSWRKGKYCF